jgi:hypothetical protein
VIPGFDTPARVLIMFDLIPIMYRVPIKAGILLFWSLLMAFYGAHFQKQHDTVTAQSLEIKNNNVIIDTIQRLNQKNMEATKLSNDMGILDNEKKAEIDALERDSRKLFADSRVSRKLCTSSDERLPENTHTGSITSEATIAPQISKFFEEFLISEFYRGDQLGIYAEVAHEWIEKLDPDHNGFICD